MAKPAKQPRLQPIERDALPASPAALPEHGLISDAEVQRAIAETAYYRAEQRGFTPGGELEDWLLAEAQVKSSLGRSASN